MWVCEPMFFAPLPWNHRRRPGRADAGKRRPRRPLLAASSRRAERRRPKMDGFAPSRVSPGSAHHKNLFLWFGQIRSKRGNFQGINSSKVLVCNGEFPS